MDGNNIIVEKFKKIRYNLLNDKPLLLIDSIMLTSILNIENYTGVEMVNLFRNSTLKGSYEEFKATTYYRVIIQLLDDIIAGEKRVIRVNSIDNTVALATPITVVAPDNGGDGKVQLRVVTNIDTIITRDTRLLDKYEYLKSKGISEKDITPIEVVMGSNLEDKEKIDFIEQIFLSETRIVSQSFPTQDDFYELFGNSDGFIINYGENSYIIVGESNEFGIGEDKESVIYNISNGKIVETDETALDMIFF